MDHEQLMLNTQECCKLIGLGRTKLLQLAYSGEIPSRKVGRRRLYSFQAVRDWANKPGEKDNRFPGTSEAVADVKTV
jgi:excisionase family DNA binding protein